MTLEQPQLDALLAEFGVAVRRSHARRRRRRMAGTFAAIVTALIASVAVAGTAEDWWTDARPPADPSAIDATAAENAGLIAIDLSKKALVARIPGSELDAVATKSGGYCLIALHEGKPIDSGCDDTPVKADGSASRYTSRTSDFSKSGSEQWWIGYGRITDGRAASIDLSSVGLPASVPLQRGGFFLFDIPQSEWSHVGDRVGTMTIRDAAGDALRTGCIYTGVAPGKAFSGGGGIGAAGEDCNNYRPVPPPTIDYANAQKVAELTLTRDHGYLFINGKPTDSAGLTVALWQARNNAGETCMLYAAASEPPTAPMDPNGRPILTGNPAHSINCGGAASGSSAFSIGVSSDLVDGEYTEMIAGVFSPSSGISKLQLLAADGTTLPITYGGNGFLAELPNAPRDGNGPGPIPGGPYTVVGYDDSGRKVASQQVLEKPAPGKYEVPSTK